MRQLGQFATLLLLVSMNACPGLDAAGNPGDRPASGQPATTPAQEKLQTEKIPDGLLGYWRSESLPESGVIESWPSMPPVEKAFIPMGEGDVNVERIDGRRYAMIKKKEANGLTLGSFPDQIPCKGASVVVAVRPMRQRGKVPWNSIVDVFYDRLTIGIHNNTGSVCVHVNGELKNSEAIMPENQVAILSLVVEPDGSYVTYANGRQIISGKSEEDMTVLEPGVAGPFAHEITIGRNAPDPWTTFNGAIGAVYLYAKSLSSMERQQLEQELSGLFRDSSPKSSVAEKPTKPGF